MNNLPASIQNSRCIVHIDLDCFYCQVEQVRLGVSPDIPTAVRQWQALIAVNYAARNAGVKRHCRVDQALEICPDIKFFHVATYGPNDTEPKYYDNPDRQTHKVSLEAYRLASKKIFRIFHKYCSKVQKLGLDEAYMDITDVVNKRLIEMYINGRPDALERIDDIECGIEVGLDQLGCVIESEEEEARRLSPEFSESGSFAHWSPTTWATLQLVIGAEIAAEIRKEIYDELHYTCSAGIAHCKTTAKLCSKENKPNKQTILREEARLTFMKNIPFNEIKNLGGKLGSEIESGLNIHVAGDLWPYSIEDLQSKFGESTGRYLYHVCRGIENEEVIPTKGPKSIMAAKSFNPSIRNSQKMNHWFFALAVELRTRLFQNHEEYGTWPRSFALHYSTSNQYSVYKSKTMGAMSKEDIKTPDKLIKRISETFHSLGDNCFPCTGLQVHATHLESDQSLTSHNISNFFTKEKDVVESDSNTINKKKDFLSASDLPPNDIRDDIDSWTCDECHQNIPSTQKTEHQDYHVALKLQMEENKRGSQASSSVLPSKRTTEKRKKAKNKKDELSESDKRAKRLSFFQPRPI